MATSSLRKVQVIFEGDFTAESNIYSAAENAASPATHELKTLGIGGNTITPPAGGSTPVAITIIPPVGNTTLITLKGGGGDSGVALHLTDPTSIGLDSTVVNFVLWAAAEIIGVQLIWS